MRIHSYEEGALNLNPRTRIKDMVAHPGSLLITIEIHYFKLIIELRTLALVPGLRSLTPFKPKLTLNYQYKGWQVFTSLKVNFVV